MNGFNASRVSVRALDSARVGNGDGGESGE